MNYRNYGWDLYNGVYKPTYNWGHHLLGTNDEKGC